MICDKCQDYGFYYNNSGSRVEHGPVRYICYCDAYQKMQEQVEKEGLNFEEYLVFSEQRRKQEQEQKMQILYEDMKKWRQKQQQKKELVSLIQNSGAV